MFLNCNLYKDSKREGKSLLSWYCTTVLLRISDRWLRILESLKPDCANHISEGSEGFLGFTSGWLLSLLVMVIEVEEEVGMGVIYAYPDSLCMGSKGWTQSGILQVHWNSSWNVRPQEVSIWDFPPYTMEEYLADSVPLNKQNSWLAWQIYLSVLFLFSNKHRISVISVYRYRVQCCTYNKQPE